jgi:hypothetical protein
MIPGCLVAAHGREYLADLRGLEAREGRCSDHVSTSKNTLPRVVKVGDSAFGLTIRPIRYVA